MFLHLLVLELIAKSGGGAGLSKLHDKIADGGFSFSKYMTKKSLKELQEIGAVTRVGNVWFLTLLGANLHVADQAAAQGYNCGWTESDGYMPVYQKELVK